MARVKYLFFIFVFISMIFLSSLSVSAASNTSDPSGFNSWSLDEKIVYWTANIGNLIGSITGIGNCPSLEESITRIANTGYYTDGYDSYVDFVAQNSSYDDEDGTWVFSDGVIKFLNDVKAETKNKITYQNMYLPSAVQIDASTFATKSAYSKFYALVESNPDKIFSICRATHSYNNYKNISGWTIRVHDADVCGVSSEVTSGMGKFNVNVFDSEWQQNYTWIEFYLCDAGSNSKLVYKNASDEWVEIDDVEEVKTFDMSLVTNTYGSGTTTKFGSTRASWNSSVDTQNQIFTDFNGAFPVYVSVTAMKQGTSNGTCGQFMPGYTPGEVTDNSITQTEINDYSTNYNYYYGSGSGGSSGDSGSGSGDGFFDSFLNALGSLGDAVLGILSKLIEFIAKAVSFITDAFSDIASLAENGFTDLLTAFFPFLPSEWVAAITLLLALAVFGVVINLFGK